MFLCLLVFRAWSIKQKCITLKIKKKYFAIWIFDAMSGYEFYFFMTTLKFLKINMGKLFPVLKKYVGVCLSSFPVCHSRWWHAQNGTNQNTTLCCITVLSHVEICVAGGLRAPSGRVVIDNQNLTSTCMGNSRYALPIPK